MGSQRVRCDWVTKHTQAHTIQCRNESVASEPGEEYGLQNSFKNREVNWEIKGQWELMEDNGCIVGTERSVWQVLAMK